MSRVDFGGAFLILASSILLVVSHHISSKCEPEPCQGCSFLVGRLVLLERFARFGDLYPGYIRGYIVCFVGVEGTCLSSNAR
jgi:hypothetical protein